MKHIVEQDGLRIDRYCAQYLPQLTSLNRAKKWLKSGCILLNGHSVETSRYVYKGDTLLVVPPSSSVEVYQREIPVHYQDEHLAIVEKPAGIPVSGKQRNTLRNVLPYNLKPSLCEDALPQPEPVHRLDRRTQGLMIIAKTNSSRHQLGTMFSERRIEKWYRCLVLGKLSSGESHQPIDGKDSHSSWTCVATQQSHFTGWISHLHVQLHTGRQHQIRRHLHGLGHPVLGDDLYAVGPPLRSKGLYLFATDLLFHHPINDVPMVMRLPTPDKLLRRLEYEKRCCRST